MVAPQSEAGPGGELGDFSAKPPVLAKRGVKSTVRGAPPTAGGGKVIAGGANPIAGGGKVTVGGANPTVRGGKVAVGFAPPTAGFGKVTAGFAPPTVGFGKGRAGLSSLRRRGPRLDQHSRLEAWNPVTWPAATHAPCCHRQAQAVAPAANRRQRRRSAAAAVPAGWCHYLAEMSLSNCGASWSGGVATAAEGISLLPSGLPVLASGAAGRGKRLPASPIGLPRLGKPSAGNGGLGFGRDEWPAGTGLAVSGNETGEAGMNGLGAENE